MSHGAPRCRSLLQRAQRSYHSSALMPAQSQSEPAASSSASHWPRQHSASASRWLRGVGASRRKQREMLLAAIHGARTHARVLYNVSEPDATTPEMSVLVFFLFNHHTREKRKHTHATPPSVGSSGKDRSPSFKPESDTWRWRRAHGEIELYAPRMRRRRTSETNKAIVCAGTLLACARAPRHRCRRPSQQRSRRSQRHGWNEFTTPPVFGCSARSAPSRRVRADSYPHARGGTAVAASSRAARPELGAPARQAKPTVMGGQHTHENVHSGRS